MSGERRPITYNSAIDRWLIAVVAAGPLLAAASGIYMFLAGKPGEASLMFLIGGMALALTLLFMFPCRYTLLEDTLSIRCGLVFYQLSLADIVSVTRSATLLSGAALSLQRVEIKTTQRRYIISPGDRDQFIADLERAIDETRTRCTPNPSPLPSPSRV